MPRWELWIALRTNDEKKLELVVGHHDEVLAYYDVGRVSRVTEHATVDVVTFDSRDHVGDYHGPILFAVRVPVGDSISPSGGAASPGEAALAIEELVVFHRDAALRVVHRRLGAATWTPTLSLMFRKGTTFEPVGSADPH